jgi:hypothetical protein
MAVASRRAQATMGRILLAAENMKISLMRIAGLEETERGVNIHPGSCYESQGRGKTFPRWLKPQRLCALSGTTEFVRFQNKTFIT